MDRAMHSETVHMHASSEQWLLSARSSSAEHQKLPLHRLCSGHKNGGIIKVGAAEDQELCSSCCLASQCRRSHTHMHTAALALSMT